MKQRMFDKVRLINVGVRTIDPEMRARAASMSSTVTGSGSAPSILVSVFMALAPTLSALKKKLALAQICPYAGPNLQSAFF